MKTNRIRIRAMVGSLALLLGIAGARAVAAIAAEPQAQPKYTRAEYDAYQAAAAEKNLQQKIKLLDDFVAKYPSSALLAFVYNEYVTDYYQLHQWSKDIEYLDKFLALSDINEGARLAAEYQRSALFEAAYSAKAPDAKEQASKAREAAVAGLKVLEAFKKPEQMSDQDWAGKKSQYAVQFYNTAGVASLYLKDYKSAVDYFSKSVAESEVQPAIYYSMGKADLQEDPPQYMDGFWAVARALDQKLPEADKVAPFLHERIYNYQLPLCDSLVDSQMKELLALAQNSKTRPASYTIPSAADLAKIREKDTAGILAGLRGGGDTAKTTWLAVCNGEFPESFFGKVYEVNAATPTAIVVKAAIGSTEDEVNASTTPNCDLKITGQPEAARLEKDPFRFSGKLTGYTPDPFYLTWENVKVNPEDIPEEKGKKPAKKPAKKP
ncbi:MAG TPA: hypothetical protein VJW51_05365 [Candidatus Acidoferrales bacterium]|nr:hypothetical protein [Candidatus Acidoferrales bacterium]